MIAGVAVNEGTIQWVVNGATVMPEWHNNVVTADPDMFNAPAETFHFPIEPIDED